MLDKVQSPTALLADHEHGCEWDFCHSINSFPALGKILLIRA